MTTSEILSEIKGYFEACADRARKQAVEAIRRDGFVEYDILISEEKAFQHAAHYIAGTMKFMEGSKG